MVPISTSSIAAKLDIVCKRGDSFNRAFRFWQDALKTIPKVITDSTFRMRVAKERQAPVLDFDFVYDDAQTLSISKTAEEMKVPLAGIYKYDLQETYLDGTIQTILMGKFTIDPDITIEDPVIIP